MPSAPVLAALLASPPTTSGARTLKDHSRREADRPPRPRDRQPLQPRHAEPARPEPTRLGRGRAGSLRVQVWVLPSELRMPSSSRGGSTGSPARPGVTGTPRYAGYWTMPPAMGIPTPGLSGGQPRHPSRGHQYVSDRHGRTGPGNVEEGLRLVLVQVPLAELQPGCPHGLRADHEAITPFSPRSVSATITCRRRSNWGPVYMGRCRWSSPGPVAADARGSESPRQLATKEFVEAVDLFVLGPARGSL